METPEPLFSHVAINIILRKAYTWYANSVTPPIGTANNGEEDNRLSPVGNGRADIAEFLRGEPLYQPLLSVA